MREFSVPAKVRVAPSENLTDAIVRNARDHADHVSFSHKAGDRWLDVTAGEFAEQVCAAARGLVAAGIAPGERVALMSRTRYEWTVLDYAIWYAGAVTVPIYETSSAEQVAWILGDSEAVAMIVETADHEAVLERVRDRVPAVRLVWRLDDAALARLGELGRGTPEDELEARRTSRDAESLATIIYTSGTTGRPKGCELTHRNFLFEVETISSGLSDLFSPDRATLLFLPLAHVFARAIQCGAVRNRTRLGHTADIRNLLDDLAQFRPDFVLSVPRVFEKVYNTAKLRAHADGKGAIFDRAERVAVAHSQAQDTGRAGPLLRLQHSVFDRLVYARLRAVLGGRCTAAISGGAPLGARLGHFYRGIGLTVREGYGLTETSAGVCVNLPDALKIGSVGRPFPGLAVRIADDGEVLVRGEVVFRGYWHNEQATKEAIDDEGWLRTGDLGELDDEGFLTITGRKKELLVTAAGKNVSPAILEDRLRAHPLISQCIVVGDGQPFVAALVTIDPDALPAWGKAHGKPLGATVAELREDPDLVAEIQAAVDDANSAVSRAEAIRRFRILAEDFTEHGGQLTPTMKLKRAVVMKENAAEVAALYSGEFRP